METYDPVRIGRRIAWGGEHYVHDYGDAEVIKFSLLDRYIWKRNALAKAEYDLRLAREAFGEYLLPTRLLMSPDGYRLAKVQPKIVGRPLRKSDLADSRVERQLADIAERRKTLRAQESEIDLVGGLGFLTGTLANIFILSDGSLRIIDALLVSLPWHSPLSRIARFARIIIAWRQDLLLSEYLKRYAPYEDPHPMLF